MRSGTRSHARLVPALVRFSAPPPNRRCCPVVSTRTCCGSGGTKPRPHGCLALAIDRRSMAASISMSARIEPMGDVIAPAELMDRLYRRQRHVYDATRKYYLLGRDRLIVRLAP